VTDQDFDRIHRGYLDWHERTRGLNADQLADLIDAQRTAMGLPPIKWPPASQLPRPNLGLPSESLTPWIHGREVPPNLNADILDLAFYESLKHHPSNLKTRGSGCL
jgi:hypothetical protein